MSNTTYVIALTCKIFEDRHVGKDDLRLKLMRKGLLQRSNGGAEHNEVDLREKLSRNHKSLPRYDARGHAPESRARYDMRDNPPELRSRYSSREGVLASRPSPVASRIPSARSVDDLLKLDSSRKSYSSWTADGLRHRSPERLTSGRGDASPPRAYDQIMPMPSHRSAGSSRPQSLITRDAPDTSRTQTYAGKSAISVDTVQRANGIIPSSAALPAAPVMVCICTPSHRPDFTKASEERKDFLEPTSIVLFALNTVMELTFKPECKVMTYLSLTVRPLMQALSWWNICSFVWLFIARIKNLLRI
jgi:hypothetical protein